LYIPVFHRPQTVVATEETNVGPGKVVTVPASEPRQKEGGDAETQRHIGGQRMMGIAGTLNILSDAYKRSAKE